MKIKKWAGIPALLCALALLLAPPALAAGRVCSLTLSCAVGGSPVAGVVCSLYRVAAVDGTTFVPTAAFQQARVGLDGLETDAQWQAAADSLAVFAAADVSGVAPDGQARTDADGRASFTGLPTGLYLAVFAAAESGRGTCRFAPDLLALPRWDGSGAVSYDVTAAPKGEIDSPPSDDRPAVTDITVLKVWNDGGEQTRRPQQVSVALFCDGVSYDTQQLTADNNWRRSWSNLPRDHVWTVLETPVPDNCTVTYTEEGTVLTVINQVTTAIPDTPTPGGTTPATPPPTPGTTTPAVPETPGKLPYTGQLWWPVPVLTGAGLLLFVCGWRKRRADGREE